MSEALPPLRAFRLAQTPKLTLSDLAADLGVTEGQVSRIEREGTDSLPMALKLAELTGMPVQAFAKNSEAA